MKAAIERRLRQTATVPGSGQTIQFVADTAMSEWAAWMTMQHPELWKSMQSELKDVNKKIVDRTIELIEHSRQYRDKLLGNEGRDVMRAYMLRWIGDEVHKLSPSIMTDRSLPRTMRISI